MVRLLTFYGHHVTHTDQQRAQGQANMLYSLSVFEYFFIFTTNLRIKGLYESLISERLSWGLGQFCMTRRRTDSRSWRWKKQWGGEGQYKGWESTHRRIIAATSAKTQTQQSSCKSSTDRVISLIAQNEWKRELYNTGVWNEPYIAVQKEMCKKGLLFGYNYI